jgi:hypothetical protein
VKTIKGSKMRVVHNLEEQTNGMSQAVNSRSPASGQNRSLASKTEESENILRRPETEVYWLIAVLALLGAWTRFFKQKSVK